VKIVAFDCETHPFGAGNMAPDVICAAWSRDGKTALLTNALETVIMFDHLLRNSDYTLVNVNIGYDVASILATACRMPDFDDAFRWRLNLAIFKAYRAGRILSIDRADMLIRIASDTFDHCPKLGREPVKPSSLAQMRTVWLGHPLVEKKGADHIRTRFREVAHLHPNQYPPEFKDYVSSDATEAYRIAEIVLTYDLPDLVAQSCKAYACQLTQVWGVTTDAQSVDELDARLSHSVSTMQSALAAAGLGTWSRAGVFKKSKAAIAARVSAAYAAQGLSVPLTEPTTKFPNGQVRANTETLFESGDPLLIQLACVGQDFTEMSTFLPWLREGARASIHPGFYNPVATGRIGCRSPNITNQPRRKGVRECYRSRPGYVFVTCDLPAAELVALAQVWLERYGQSRLADAINQGKDPHIIYASELLRSTYDATLAAYKSGDILAAETRQLAKIGNFGLPGMLSPDSFYLHVLRNTRKDDGTFPAWVQAFTRERSREVCQTWARTWPESQAYFNEAKRATAGRRGCALREPKSGRLRGGLRATTWCNTQFQGRIADAATSAWFTAIEQAHTNPQSGLWLSRSVALIHDEILLESPEERAHDAALALADCMQRVMGHYCPDIRVKCSASLMRRWYKGAEPVYVDGRLVPAKPTKNDAGKTVWVHDKD
jgi:DNA polymerase-1